MFERLHRLLSGYSMEDGLHKDRSLEDRELRVEMTVAAVDALMISADHLERKVEEVQNLRDSD